MGFQVALLLSLLTSLAQAAPVAPAVITAATLDALRPTAVRVGPGVRELCVGAADWGATLGADGLTMWSMARPRAVRLDAGNGGRGVSAIGCLPGRRVATAWRAGELFVTTETGIVWDTDAGLGVDEELLEASLFSAGQYAVVGPTVYDVRKGRTVGAFPGCAPVAASAGVGAVLYACGDGSLLMVRLPELTARLLHVPAGTGALSPDASVLFMQVPVRGGCRVVLWDVASDTARGRPNVDDCEVETSSLPSFSPDGTLLVRVGYDDAVQVWDVALGAVVRRLPCADGCTRVAFSPDGAAIVAAPARGSKLTVWHVAP